MGTTVGIEPGLVVQVVLGRDGGGVDIKRRNEFGA